MGRGPFLEGHRDAVRLHEFWFIAHGAKVDEGRNPFHAALVKFHGNHCFGQDNVVDVVECFPKVDSNGGYSSRLSTFSVT